MQPHDAHLDKESAKLFGIPKRNVYQVPDGFFTEMEADIRQNYPQPKKGLYRQLKKWAKLSVAAAIVFLVIFSGVKALYNKQYFPVETDRGIYTVQDGNIPRE